jgi:5-formyltetrahydrofolate cyclo-ligase
MSISSKAAIRKGIKRKLESLSASSIAEQSRLVCDKVCNMPLYQQSHAVSVYLSMPKEIDTTEVIRHSLSSLKRVFIPKIIGSRSQDMIMVEIKAYEDIESFPKNAWGIPEPDEDYIAKYPDMSSANIIDLVLVPAVAFDRHCIRVGHGKGYYGRSKLLAAILTY